MFPSVLGDMPEPQAEGASRKGPVQARVLKMRQSGARWQAPRETVVAAVS